MQNADNAIIPSDRTSKAVDKINSPQFDVPALYASMGGLNKMPALDTPAWLPSANSLLPSDGRSLLPPDIKVGNVPGPGSGSGGDNSFGPTPPWARNFDRKDIPQDIKVGDVPGPGSKAPGVKLDTIPGHDPATDVINPNRERQTEKEEDSKRVEQERLENARQAADILNGKGDLGNEYQRNQIKEMYRKALEEGGQEAADKLTMAINKELERRGSDVRVSSSMEFPTMDQPGDGVRLKVMKGSQQVDEARVARPSIWEKRGMLD